MNPSSSQWVKKFGVDFERKSTSTLDFEALYNRLIEVGFVYGLHFKTVETYSTSHELLADEIAKLNLLYGLTEVHALCSGTRDYNLFLEDVLLFYKPLIKSSSFLKKLITKEPNSTLEDLIDRRIKNKNNPLTQLFSSNFFNAFVIFDVISFYHFLKEQTNFDDSYGYLKELSILYSKKTLFQIPESKHELYGILIAHLSADSLFDNYDADSISNDVSWYHRYAMDFNSILIYAQDTHSHNYQSYLEHLAVELKVSPTQYKSSLQHAQNFTKEFESSLDSLKGSNTIHRFHKNVNHLAERLIKRNSKRILKELVNSKELLLLLSHSTYRELSAEEQKKVQQYALDIAKSIPSIAIFMLPGGALLLPIFIRLIPKLLPSAFDENRIE